MQTNVKLQSALCAFYVCSWCLETWDSKYRIIVVVSFLVEFGSKGETRCTRLAIRKRRNTEKYVPSCEIRSQILRAVSIRVGKMLQRETSHRCSLSVELYDWRKHLLACETTLAPPPSPPFPRHSLQLALARVRFYGHPLMDFPERRTNVLVLQRKSNCLFPLTSLHFTQLRHILDNCS